MRFLPLALAALVLAPAAQAQLLPSISLGVAGGPNFSSFNEVAGTELEGTTGFHIGVYGDVAIPFVSFRTGVFYLQAGDVQTTSGDERISADFVTVPVDLRFSTPTPVVQAYALVGPELRFPIGSVEDGVVDKSSVNVAANVGVGVGFNPPLVGPSGFLELRYSQDVTGFAEQVNAVETDNEYKVSLVQLRLGIGL
ncbi:MAG TPA: outer membrane beta-barrel protein [Rubricoccaceae bacterium]|jgi:hypothetical protein